MLFLSVVNGYIQKHLPFKMLLYKQRWGEFPYVHNLAGTYYSQAFYELIVKSSTKSIK